MLAVNKKVEPKLDVDEDNPSDELLNCCAVVQQQLKLRPKIVSKFYFWLHNN